MSSVQSVSLTADLLDQLLAEPENRALSEAAHLSNRQALADLPHCCAFVTEYGRCVAVIGLGEHWPGRFEGWAIFSLAAGPHMAAIHRKVRRWLDENTGFKRIEATVELNFERGHKWMRMLGFTKEAECLRQYKDGRDFTLYARVQL